jgi:hypothetical protein
MRIYRPGGDRVTRIAAIIRQRKTPAKGASVALLSPLFRLLARTGLLRWFVNRQRLVRTFATNLRGPGRGPLAAAGHDPRLRRRSAPRQRRAGRAPRAASALGGGDRGPPGARAGQRPGWPVAGRVRRGGR